MASHTMVPGTIAVFIGPPGSGKGTIAEMLEKKEGFHAISAGELLREEISKGTSIGKDIKDTVEKGKLVPPLLIVELMKMETAIMHKKGKKRIIWDGFPRSLEQARATADIKVAAVVCFEVSEEEVVQRLSGRRVCGKGTHTYHTEFLPPQKPGICDHDGTRLRQREDDTPGAIRQRFRVYEDETRPVIEYYRKKKMLHAVNASSTPEEVYESVKKAIRSS